MTIKYIVTGTGRCGTKFMSKYLTSAGIKCGHEVIFFNDGLEQARLNSIIHRDMDAESSYMAAPYLDSDLLAEAKIIHIVRDPLKVINSFVVAFCYFYSSIPTSDKQKDKTWVYEYPPGADPEFKFMKFMWHHVPKLGTKKISPIERAAIYYVEWNQMIEKACQGREFLFHPIESDIANVSKFIGVENTGLYSDKTENKVEYENKYTLYNMPSGPIKDSLILLGRKYGYLKEAKIML